MPQHVHEMVHVTGQSEHPTDATGGVELLAFDGYECSACDYYTDFLTEVALHVVAHQFVYRER